jgi:RNase P subunit RPR2
MQNLKSLPYFFKIIFTCPNPVLLVPGTKTDLTIKDFCFRNMFVTCHLCSCTHAYQLKTVG